MPPTNFFSLEGDVLLKPNPFDFYSFAVYIHPITHLTAGTKVRDNPAAIEILTATRVMCLVFSLDPFCIKYLPSAAKRANSLEVIISGDFLTPPEKGGFPDCLSNEAVRKIHEHVHAFDTSLRDELGKLPIFCCDDDKIGNLSVDKLLKGASGGYPEKTRKNLTPHCLSEIDEAGRCLVYERSTAAGFHMLRSVELTIRQYLLAVPGFTLPPLNRQNWGEYLKLLKDNGAGKEITDHLHNIKDNYRNPLMHPDDTLEMDEAVSLFGVSQSMNEMLITDMKKRGWI